MKMCDWPTKEQVAALRERFKDGTRVKFLGSRDPDPYAPVPVGALGVVRDFGVDDAGTVHVKWDEGRYVGGCVFGVDSIVEVK